MGPRILAFLTALVLVAVGHSSASEGPEEQKYCSRKHAKQIVKTFVRAHNDGDIDLLDELFAQGSSFGIYQVGPVERPYPLSDDRSTLMDYFRNRHQQGDVITISKLRLSRERGSVPEHVWGFRFTLKRESKEMAPWAVGTFHGKGAVDCVLYAWNMSWEE